MDKKTKKELQRIVALGTRLGILIKLGEYNRRESIAIIVRIIINLSKFPSEIESQVIMGIPPLLDKVVSFLDEDDMMMLKLSIASSGITPVSFVQQMEIEQIDGNELLKLGRKKSPKLTEQEIRNMVPPLEFTDESQKKVGQKVRIGHALFTNMLVTKEGVQMPSKSFYIPAVKELMGLEATVLEIECKGKKYLCGACSQLHNAEVRISFEDYNMEFYINNLFLKPFENE